ncbi:MAG: DUF1990 domain-containing protein [Planctomyces sp.]|nr:DUF1990 domain-containing protein [Planctomyces sp.]
MFQLTHPTHDTVRQLMLAVEEADYNYAEHPLLTRPKTVGLEAGYRHDHVREEVGSGLAVFETAVAAFRDWKMFPPAMVELLPLRDEIAVGNIVAIIARGGGLWSYNACRIFEVVDDETETEQRFGFSYATLPHHVARGEERFLLRYNRDTEQVTYEIEVFSRADHWTAKLTAPYFRHIQRRFRRLSMDAIRTAVQSGNQVPPSPVPGG